MASNVLNDQKSLGAGGESSSAWANSGKLARGSRHRDDGWGRGGKGEQEAGVVDLLGQCEARLNLKGDNCGRSLARLDFINGIGSFPISENLIIMTIHNDQMAYWLVRCTVNAKICSLRRNGGEEGAVLVFFVIVEEETTTGTGFGFLVEETTATTAGSTCGKGSGGSCACECWNEGRGGSRSRDEDSQGSKEKFSLFLVTLGSRGSDGADEESKGENGAHFELLIQLLELLWYFSASHHRFIYENIPTSSYVGLHNSIRYAYDLQVIPHCFA